MAGGRQAGDSGSIFVEAMIAAAIVAMALSGTFKVIADNATRARAAEARRAALLVGQSELADVGAEIPVAPGTSEGVSGDLLWRVDVAPYADESQSGSVGALFAVTVSVSPAIGGPALVTLSTLRLARPA
jgi:hypothetical protein